MFIENFIKWLLVLMCFSTVFTVPIITDERQRTLQHVNDSLDFWCGVIDPYNTYYGILVKVDPTNFIQEISSPYISYINSSVFQYCTNTIALLMMDCKLWTLEKGTLKGLGNLALANFFNNEIEYIGDGTFNDTPKLKELDLSYNRLTELAEGVRNGLKQLRKLHLNKNPIVLREGGFTGLSKLELLELSGANISTIPVGSLKGLRQLQRLDLSSNNLTVLSDQNFRDLILLEELDLSNNTISVIGQTAFEGLTNLKSLWLNDNQIQSLVSEITFEGIPNLDHLYLHKNPLFILDVAVFKMMRNLSIEPGFKIDSSEMIRTNFANETSMIISCAESQDYFTAYNCITAYYGVLQKFNSLQREETSV